MLISLSKEQRSQRSKKAAATRKAQKQQESASGGGVVFLDDLPLPQMRNRYPWIEKMPVAKYVRFEDQDEYHRAYSTCNNYGKKHNKTFAGRKMDGWFGIWRVK